MEIFHKFDVGRMNLIHTYTHYNASDNSKQTFGKPAKCSRTSGPASDQLSQDRKTFPRTELKLLLIRGVDWEFITAASRIFHHTDFLVLRAFG